MACGVVMVRVWPRVNVSASFTKSTMAAMMWRQGGPTCGHWVQFLGQISHQVAPWAKQLGQDSFGYAFIFLHNRGKWFGDIRQPDGQGRQQGLF